jgi:lipoprotein-releasing system ATP-binding protein
MRVASGLHARATGLAALVATHNTELASRMDRRVTLLEGKIVNSE